MESIATYTSAEKIQVNLNSEKQTEIYTSQNPKSNSQNNSSQNPNSVPQNNTSQNPNSNSQNNTSQNPNSIPQTNPSQTQNPNSNSQNNTSENLKSNSEDIWIPQLGMEFESEQSAYDFYNKYAFKTGFGIRWSWKHSLKNSNEAKDRTFCCSRQGFKKHNFKKVTNKDKIVTETRCDCNARMKIVLNNGVYKVYEFISEHNHPLLMNNQITRLRSHRFVKKSENRNKLRVLDVKCTSNKGWDPVHGYKELCAMFIQVAQTAAQSKDTFNLAVNYKNQLVEDLKIVLKNRVENNNNNNNNKRLNGDFEGLNREKKLKPEILAEEGSSEGQWQLSDSSDAS